MRITATEKKLNDRVFRIPAYLAEPFALKREALIQKKEPAPAPTLEVEAVPEPAPDEESVTEPEAAASPEPVPEPEAAPAK